MHPVYHAKITVSTKNFPRSEGRKCGVKDLVQWRGLMAWSRSWWGVHVYVKDFGKNEVALARYLRGVGFKGLQRTWEILQPWTLR